VELKKILWLRKGYCKMALNLKSSRRFCNLLS
jgi:hypothetical protein